MLERYARLPIDSPRQIILVVALITLIISPFVLKVEFSTDVQAFLPQSEEVETYDAITEDFGKDSSVVNLYLTSVSGSNVLTMDNLVDILQLHNDCLQIDGVKGVLSVADFFDSALLDSGLSLSAVKSTEEPWELVYDSISTSGSGNYSWNEVDFVGDVLINKDLNLDPLIIVESEGSVRGAPIANSTIIMVNLDPDLSTEQKKEAGQKLRTLADSHNQDSGSDISADAFSVDLLASDVDESTQYTNILMIVGMLLVTVVLLWLTFRHWSYVVLPIITLILSIFWTFSFAGIVGIKMTALGVAVIPLVVGLGIDFSVHVSRRYQEGIAAGSSVEDSLIESQVHTGQALSLAMFTTVIAFLSGITGGVGPVRDFSLLCAFGIFSSFILTLFFYTSMRFLLDSSSEEMAVKPQNSELIESTIIKASQIVDKHPQAIISTVIIVTILALGGASQIETSFSLDDFLSDDLEIMVTAEKIQSDFRGASYSQSQILIQGDIDSTDFIDGNYELQYGQSSSDNKGLNDDRYVIKVGANARVESVHEIVQKAIDSEEYSVNYGENLTHEWTITNSFLVTSGDNLDVHWTMEQSAVSPSLEAIILWYDSSNELLGTEKLTNIDISTELSSSSSASIQIFDNSYKARLKFSHLQDVSEDSLIQSIEVNNRERYVFVQSLTDTFNLTYQAKTFSLTTDSDIHNLYDYLYQRELDIADPFTGESYSDEIKHVLNVDSEGNYVSSVVRIYVGPTTSYELDNDGLEFMRSELDADIPDIFVENFTVSTTGGHVLTSVTVNEIQKTQISSTLIAILFAAITLVIIYRSVDLGIIAVFPTILASIWILATMTLLGITLNVLTVMVTALTIGLGIDYAIHIVERYREEIEHKTESQAIETTIVRTGSALLISGLTTVSGFAVLFLSPMPLVRNFGIITAATIIYSMFIAIFVLPSLIWISNRIKEWISSQTLD
ncbi:MMPL family transporter [Marine Group III euryarchaeote]|nr:MMPL family transporter [Marine Group III euryarchaeote]